MDEFLNQAQLAGELRLFDLQFEKTLSQINGKRCPELSLAAALVSSRLANGDTCVALADVQSLGLYTNPELKPFIETPPSVAAWRDVLLTQKVVGQPAEKTRTELKPDDKNTDKDLLPEIQNDKTPLILDAKNRLYLGRYWHYEQSLLSSINQLLELPAPIVNQKMLSSGLDKLFPQSGGIDWQSVAAAMAVQSRLCVITGGPGTGKTYTVAAILTLLEQQAEGGKVPAIALAAPTGKAAARLTESVQSSFKKIHHTNQSAYQDIEAVTLHRLLGIRPGKLQPRFNRDNPLPCDLLIVDEASMVDLPLMARTFEALANDCRIILLGDKDQLASVESGIVLGDMCGGLKEVQFSESVCKRLQQVTRLAVPVFAQSEGKIANHIVHLQKSHRSVDSGGINAIATAVNRGDVTSCLDHFGSTSFDNLTLIPHSVDNIDNTLLKTVVPVYQNIHALDDPQKALDQMSGVCVLCALKKGRSGAEGINRRVEALLATTGAIDRDQFRGRSANDRGGHGHAGQDRGNDNYYPGKPVMITENNGVQKLFNGDHGLVLADPQTNELRVHFPGEQQTRAFAPSRLPEHQTFYAMTIHKSQGSEYDTVLLVLPDTDSEILSRELLYTAITRARKQVIVIANEQQLRKAIETRVERQSGLLDALWPQKPVQTETPRKKKKLLPDGMPLQTTLDF